MRIQAADVSAVITALKANPVKPMVGPIADYDNWLTPLPGESQVWARMVGWESLKHAKKLEFYRFPDDAVSGWGGGVIVDRKRKLLFVGAIIY